MESSASVRAHTPLCSLADKFLTDKGPLYHGYTKHYHAAIQAYLSDQPVRRVGEIGIGFLDCMCHISETYKPGASLRMWEAFFPEAEVHGFDIREELLYTEGRVQCHFMDQEQPASICGALDACCADGRLFDMILDDGSHRLHHQVNTKTLAGVYIRPGGLLIIEDIEERFLDYWFAEPPPGFQRVAISENDPLNNFVIYRKELIA